MYVEHPVFKSPILNQKIWRYMDLSKYLAILSTDKLFFCRVDKLDDRFEGSYSKPSKNWMIASNQTTESQQFRENTAINCWHMSDWESSAMWKLYLKSNEGIAIQSTFDRLRDSFNKETTMEQYIGTVDYIDFDSYYHDISNTMRPFLLKRQSYSHEMELRVLIDLWGNENAVMGDLGISSRVDVDRLIEAVYLAPNTPEWISSLIKSCNERFGYSFPIHTSSLDSPAIY